jgi:hypothetical protein
MYAKFFALASLVAAVVAIPQGGSQICSTSTQACCNQVQSVDHPAVQQALQGSGFSLADVEAAIGGVNALVGLDCSGVNVIGISGNSWYVLLPTSICTNYLYFV